jgi:hypothetical protein
MKCNKLMKVVACTVVALGAISLAKAADKAVDPSGTWTWAQPGRGGGPGGGTNTLVLKWDGSKLTGTLTAPARAARGRRGGAAPGADAGAAPATPPAAPAPTATPITNGKVEGSTISFDVVRSMGGNDITTPYKGTISGDTITGTVSMPARGGGDPTPTPWTATKQK